VHHDRASVHLFMHGWDDDIFKQKFKLCYEGFTELEKALLDQKFRQDYDLERNYRYASRSSGSPNPLELWLFTLRLLSGVSHLDMIWDDASLHKILVL